VTADDYFQLALDALLTPGLRSLFGVSATRAAVKAVQRAIATALPADTRPTPPVAGVPDAITPTPQLYRCRSCELAPLCRSCARTCHRSVGYGDVAVCCRTPSTPLLTPAMMAHSSCLRSGCMTLRRSWSLLDLPNP
jgi:hypothetical protein